MHRASLALGPPPPLAAAEVGGRKSSLLGEEYEASLDVALDSLGSSSVFFFPFHGSHPIAKKRCCCSNPARLARPARS